MSRLASLTPTTAVGASKDLLAELVKPSTGQVGDMVAAMAHSPAVLGGYLQLSRAMKRAKLSRKITERISIAVQVQQGCAVCLEAHVAAAHANGVRGGRDRACPRGHLGRSRDRGNNRPRTSRPIGSLPRFQTNTSRAFERTATVIARSPT